MPHLLAPRIGWENERLAAYLLSRFSFVANPISVADDVGSDFFCTIFEVTKDSGHDVLVPRSSFAIQVKSSAERVEIDNKIEYLMRLELPFFIGVVTQSPAQMRIYSGEFLPMLFADVGPPHKLALVPVPAADFDVNNYYERVGPCKDIRLKCPLVGTLEVDDTRQTLAPKVDDLLRICSRTLGNIATRLNEEHIYKLDESGHYHIVAGSGSARHFRLNFVKRLGEVFYNLFFILGDAPPGADLSAEIQAYDSVYHELQKLQGYTPVPEFVSVPYDQLQAALARLGGEHDESAG